MTRRRRIPSDVVIAVLTEAGYRCAVPTCRNILAIDIHHLVQVSESGSNDLSNLLALCPTCHALYHRGEISRESIYAWKAMLVSLSHAFDKTALDNLLLLRLPEADQLFVSGDGVLRFTNLIAAGLATFHCAIRNGPLELYKVSLTLRGTSIVDAWRKGDRAAVEKALGQGAA